MSIHQEVATSLAQFEGREESLKNITRYSLYTTMFYRTNLLTHSRRVSWFVEEISPLVRSVYGKEFNARRAYALALVHDDAEIIIGDIQAGNKSKMTSSQLETIHNQEKRAIDTLSQRYPEFIGAYRYHELLTESLEKETLEAQVVMLADKIDAFGEGLHEVYAGNRCFITNVVNEFGIIPLPHEYYITYLHNFSQQYPPMKKLFQERMWMVMLPSAIDVGKVCERSRLHTCSSLTEVSGYVHYDEWKNVILKNSSSNDLADLYVQKEGLKSEV